jgi:myo-inositol-1(or 4)-monophosphatase
VFHTNLSGGYSYQRELQVAQEAVLHAGRTLLEFRKKVLTVRDTVDVNLIGDADRAAEREITNRIQSEFPGDRLEGQGIAGLGGSRDRMWLIDALDGTANFARGLPFFAVSLALWEGGEPVLGVVTLPLIDERFVAMRDSPSTLNGNRIYVSQVSSLNWATVNVDLRARAGLQHGIDVLHLVARRTGGQVKSFGSPSALLCYVACGRLDAYVSPSANLWDFAAARLILEQAGGRTTDWDGEPAARAACPLLASNGRLHEELQSITRAVGSPPAE